MLCYDISPDSLQWSPVLETGNTECPVKSVCWAQAAAMEPGLRDREYLARTVREVVASYLLQWSPVLETGNTDDISLEACRCRMGCNGARS